jgi:hypothetical protein
MSRFFAALLFVLIGSPVWAQSFLDRPLPVAFDDVKEEPKVSDHNIILGLDILNGFYANSLRVKGSNTDVSGIDFSGGAERTQLTYGYGYYGLDFLRFRVHGTAGVDVKLLKWSGSGATQFEQDGSDKKTVAFYKGLKPVFGVGGDIEGRWETLVLDFAVDWRGSFSKVDDTFNTGDHESLSYRLLDYTFMVGWQPFDGLKPYAGLRYSSFDMIYRQSVSGVTFNPGPPPTFTPFTHSAEVRFDFKRNLSYVAGIDFGGTGLVGFRIEGWFGDVYGGALSLTFAF